MNPCCEQSFFAPGNMEQFQQVFLFYQGDPLPLIPQNHKVISRLDTEDPSCLGGNHNLPFFPHLDHSKDVLTLGGYPLLCEGRLLLHIRHS